MVSPDNAPENASRSLSLRGQLYLLMAALVLPLSVLLGIDAYEQGQDVLRVARAQLDVLARVGAEQVEQKILAYSDQAHALATVMSQADDAGDVCAARMRAASALSSRLDTAGVVNADGQLRCASASRHPDLSALLPEIREGVATSRAVIRTLRIDGEVRLAIVVPMTGSTGAPRVLVALVRMDGFREALSAAGDWPGGTRMYLVERSGRLLLTHPAGLESPLATSLPGATLRLAGDGTGFDAPCADGLACFHASAPISLPDWVVLAATPSDELRHTALWEVFNRALLALFAFGAILIAAVHLKRRIEQPLTALARVVRDVAGGAYERRVQPAGAREVVELGTAFNAMLDKLALHEVQQQRERVDTLSRFRDIAESSPVAMAVCSFPDGHVLYCNQALLQLAGESEAAMLGRGLLDFCCRPEDRRHLVRELEVGASFNNREIPARRGDGTVRWLAVSGRRARFDQRDAVFVSCYDITERKQAQTSLAASEERFRVLIGALAEGVVLYDSRGHVLTSNRSAREPLAVGQADVPEAEGHEDGRFLDENGEPLRGDQHPVRQSLNSGEPRRDRVVGLRRDDGEIAWLSVNTQPLFHFEAKRPYAVVASYSDLTARVRAEHALRTSEQRYALAIRGLNEGIGEWDVAGDSVYISTRLAQIFGYPATSVRVGVEKWLSWLHPDDMERYRKALRAHLKAETDHLELELRICHADQSYHWFLFRGMAQYGEDGRAYRMVGSFGDISVRKRLELIDDIERELLGMIVAGAPLPNVLERIALAIEQLIGGARCSIMLYERASGLLKHGAAPSLSPQMRELLDGLKPDAYSGVTGSAAYLMRAMVCPDVDTDPLAVNLRPVAAKFGIRACWAVPVIAKAGDVLGTFTLYQSQVWRPAEEDERLLARAVDIAKLAIERELHEREIHMLNESLERRVVERTKQLEIANRELEAFSYSVSHDLRAPLRAINGFSHLLEESVGEKLDDESRDMLGRIRAGAERMGQLIDDILQFSRVSRSELHKADINLGDLARSVASELGEQYPDSRVSIAPLFYCRGDVSML